MSKRRLRIGKLRIIRHKLHGRVRGIKASGKKLLTITGSLIGVIILVVGPIVGITCLSYVLIPTEESYRLLIGFVLGCVVEFVIVKVIKKQQL